MQRERVERLVKEEGQEGEEQEEHAVLHRALRLLVSIRRQEQIDAEGRAVQSRLRSEALGLIGPPLLRIAAAEPGDVPARLEARARHPARLGQEGAAEARRRPGRLERHRRLPSHRQEAELAAAIHSETEREGIDLALLPGLEIRDGYPQAGIPETQFLATGLELQRPASPGERHSRTDAAQIRHAET